MMRKKVTIILLFAILVVLIGTKIVDDVVREQSLEVDAVSGTTVSSKCMIKAIENALQNK